MQTAIDNRGNDQCPWGFVYLNGTRVGFANQEVWVANGYPSTNVDLEQAVDLLVEAFGYGWYFEELDEEDYTDFEDEGYDDDEGYYDGYEDEEEGDEDE